jgi:outer membrane lipoprotein-sorting protein
MRKSLILIGLLLIGTNSIASNYMKFEYKAGTAKFNESQTNNPNFTVESDGYAISWNRDAKKYSLAAGYFNSKTKISRYINSDVGNTEVSYDGESTKVYIDILVLLLK